MSRALLATVLLGLLAVLAAVWRHPAAMLSPGTLLEGHAAITEDCFACHAPWRGVEARRCIACHALDRIGVMTTRGVPLPARRAIFHGALVEPDCAACHTDHAGPAPAARRFSHDLLDAKTREACATCHAKPDDRLHGRVPAQCATCHSPDRWRPARFEHDRFFRLEGDHAAGCETCHAQGFAQYTCYGCHEHTPDGIRREHEEEGIRDFSDCVQCHRSGEEHEGGGERDDD